MALPTDTLTAIADVSVAFAPPPIAALPDRDLMDALDDLGEIKRRADAVAAIVSAELERRSRPELGHNGLAQRLGLRTGAKLVQRLAKVTAGEAHQLVRVGEITAPVTVDSPPDLPSWLGAVGSAVRSGDLGVAAADAIRSGLGSPREGVPAEASRAGRRRPRSSGADAHGRAACRARPADPGRFGRSRGCRSSRPAAGSSLPAIHASRRRHDGRERVARPGILRDRHGRVRRRHVTTSGRTAIRRLGGVGPRRGPQRR